MVQVCMGTCTQTFSNSELTVYWESNGLINALNGQLDKCICTQKKNERFSRYTGNVQLQSVQIEGVWVFTIPHHVQVLCQTWEV